MRERWKLEELTGEDGKRTRIMEGENKEEKKTIRDWNMSEKLTK